MLEDPDVEDSVSLQVDKPAERIIFVPNLNVARNMKESEEGVVGGEEEEETEGIRRRGMRSQLLFRGVNIC